MKPEAHAQVRKGKYKMDIFLKYQKDKNKFIRTAQKPLSFYKTLQLSAKLDISLEAALNACADMASDHVSLTNEVKFLRFAARHHMGSTSQLLQDIFASYCSTEKKSTFLEFGATDGISLSNTYHLEKNLGWNGVLAEPSPQWQSALKANRPDAITLMDCIWTNSDEILEFFVSSHGVLSTISKYTKSDEDSMPGNAAARNARGYYTKVKTVSLNDVLAKYFPLRGPTYMSVDTEGSEYDILLSCDFDYYRPKFLTVEHNFSDQNRKLDKLLSQFGYIRIFERFTDFDAWYVDEKVYDRLFKN